MNTYNPLKALRFSLIALIALMISSLSLAESFTIHNYSKSGLIQGERGLSCSEVHKRSDVFTSIAIAIAKKEISYKLLSQDPVLSQFFVEYKTPSNAITKLGTTYEVTRLTSEQESDYYARLLRLQNELYSASTICTGLAYGSNVFEFYYYDADFSQNYLESMKKKLAYVMKNLEQGYDNIIFRHVRFLDEVAQITVEEDADNTLKNNVYLAAALYLSNRDIHDKQQLPDMFEEYFRKIRAEYAQESESLTPELSQQVVEQTMQEIIATLDKHKRVAKVLF